MTLPILTYSVCNSKRRLVPRSPTWCNTVHPSILIFIWSVLFNSHLFWIGISCMRANYYAQLSYFIYTSVKLVLYSSQSIKPVPCSHHCALEWPVNPFSNHWLSVTKKLLIIRIFDLVHSTNTAHSVLLQSKMESLVPKWEIYLSLTSEEANHKIEGINLPKFITADDLNIILWAGLLHWIINH